MQYLSHMVSKHSKSQNMKTLAYRNNVGAQKAHSLGSDFGMGEVLPPRHYIMSHGWVGTN
jgi:hypothetical protein